MAFLCGVCKRYTAKAQAVVTVIGAVNAHGAVLPNGLAAQPAVRLALGFGKLPHILGKKIKGGIFIHVGSILLSLRALAIPPAAARQSPIWAKA